MSMRSLTTTIDAIITHAVVAFCGVIWAILGFPYVIEVIAVAAGFVVILGAVWWMNKA